jgi:hypothetical protein
MDTLDGFGMRGSGSTTNLLSEASEAAADRIPVSMANEVRYTTRLSVQLQEVMNARTDLQREAQEAIRRVQDSENQRAENLARNVHNARRRWEQRERIFYDSISGGDAEDLGLNGLPRELVDGLNEFLQTTQQCVIPRIRNTQHMQASNNGTPPPPYSCVDTFVAQTAATRTWGETLAALIALEKDDETNRGKLPIYSLVDPLITLPTYQEVARGKNQKGKNCLGLWKSIRQGVKNVRKAVWDCANPWLFSATGEPLRWRALN